MWESLGKLMALPRDTAVYCGHEYTQANARFAVSIEPDSTALQQRAKAVDELRAAGKATLPTTIGLELETNPFLRPHVPAIQRRLGLEGKPEWEVFARIRELKNQS
jgi:hydroxyacylglutathione hydrolase